MTNTLVGSIEGVHRLSYLPKLVPIIACYEIFQMIDLPAVKLAVLCIISVSLRQAELAASKGFLTGVVINIQSAYIHKHHLVCSMI